MEAFKPSNDDVLKVLRLIAFVSDKSAPLFLFRPNLKDYRNSELKFNCFKVITPSGFLREWRKLTIRVPSDLKHRIEAIADSEGVSINQLAMYMFTREISSLEAGNNMSEYWEGYRKEDIIYDFDAVMIKVKKQNVPDWDKIKH